MSSTENRSVSSAGIRSNGGVVGGGGGGGIELGLAFPIRLEANHVINRKQVSFKCRYTQQWGGGGRGSVVSGLPHTVRGQPCHQQKTGQFQVQV